MAAPMLPPSDRDIFRYRFHHGVNLGSVFVLEKWLYPSMFPDGTEAELDAVIEHGRQHGLEATRKKWEQHWCTAVTGEDLSFISQHATAIRLPIGYYHLGPSFCSNTPFEPVADVYRNAWTFICTFINIATSNGLGVLIDLHALPGGANPDVHSGISRRSRSRHHHNPVMNLMNKLNRHIGVIPDSPQAEFWEKKRYRNLGTAAARRIAEDVMCLDGIVGLQVVNEAVAGAQNKGMWEWYDEVIKAVSEADKAHNHHTGLPVYISDAWDVCSAVQYASRQTYPTIVDTHKYFCFPPTSGKHPDAILSSIPTLPFPAHVAVGEFSSVMSGDSWSKIAPSARDDYVKRFTQAQLQKYRACAGSTYFWTAKMQWMPGGEWGFFEQVQKGNIDFPQPLPADYVLGGRGQKRGQAWREHTEHWGPKWDHSAFARGWDVGWEDGIRFLVKGAVIGFAEAWARKRLLESGETGEYAWEFEHGVMKGVLDVRHFQA
ncbi:glycoside hydrolase [Ascodesmis nigricans]|uniref:Glycoside hydrolase n=1 Tax=Ascodesmis nigricans TaxID=341454 RepID=A0A4V3SJU4_9PEZI|nr:glycoside hydrolase [Ascodesmis nigricans]